MVSDFCVFCTQRDENKKKPKFKTLFLSQIAINV
jgi:hypothetical protein